MSIASLVTRGYGSFSTPALLLLHGYGAYGAQPIGGGAIWPRTAPPDGYRSILDTAGRDIAEEDRQRLDALRREIGILKDPDPEPAVEPVEEEVLELQTIETSAAPDIEITSYQDFAAAVLAAAVREEEARRIEWLMRDDEDVLLLIAGS